MDFGVGEYTDITASNTFDFNTDNFSISFWMNKGSASGSYQPLVDFGGYSQSPYNQGTNIYSNNSNQIHIYNRGSNPSNWLTSITTSSGWNQVVIIRDGNNLTVYINNSTEQVNQTFTGVSSINFGGTATSRIGGANSWSGKIDEVAIFSRALSSNEVNTLYNSGSPSNPMLLSGKPVAYYPLGEQARKPGTAEWRFPNEILQSQLIYFDGNTDYINLDSAVNLGVNSTISFWYKTSYNNQGLVPFGGASGPYYYVVQWGSSVNKLYFRVGGTVQEFTGVTEIQDGNWHHYCITRTGANAELFVDGVSRDTLTGLPATTDTLIDVIGATSNGTSAINNSYLTQVAFWDSDQSTNIANIYNYGAPQTSYTVTPTAWYKLDKTSTFTGLNPNWHSALDFSGTNQNINLGNDASLYPGTSDMSYSFWFKSDSLSGYKTIFSQGVADLNALSTGNKAVFITTLGDELRVFVGFGQGGSWAIDNGGAFNTSNANFVAGKWYHIAFTFDRDGNGVIYVNGVPNVTQAVNGSSTSVDIVDTDNSIIGGVAYDFDGQISNFAIFNQVISPEDVKYLYNGGTPQTNISFEPTSWYKLDNLTTGIQDSGSASNNGTNNGATAVSSSVVVDEWVFENAAQSQTSNWSSALEFNRSGVNYLKIDSPALNFTDKMSFSAWAKFTNTTQDAYTIAANFDPNTGYKFLIYYYRDNNPSSSSLRVRINSANNTLQTYTVNGQLDVNKWYHLAFSFDGTTNADGFNMYIDNVKHSFTANDSGIYSNTANGTRIGNYQNNNTWAIIGEMSNVAFWDTNLSTSQINDLYNNGQPEATISHSPLSYYKLDNITTGIQDSGSASNNANITGTIPEIQTNVWTPRLNGESDTLPSTALVSSDLQFNSAYSSFSLDFDAGSSDYIDCTNSSILKPTSAYSISGWFKLNNLTGTKTIISNDNNNGYMVWVAGSNLVFYHWDSTWRTITSNTTLSANVWYNFVVTWDLSNTTGKIYINGQFDKQYTQFGQITYNSSDPVYIGTYGPSHYFDGKIDEISIFNKTLNQAEITSIYNNGYPKDITALSPISWWRLGEDAYFNGNDFIVPNQITGAPNGTSNAMPATALVADAPGSYAAGLGSSLALADRVGDAPNSTANSLSFNMTPENRISYSAGYTPAQVDNVYSMEFDGAGDYITLASGNYGFPSLTTNGQTLDNLSISVWFKNQGGSGNQVLLTWWASGTGGQPYLDAFLSYNPSNKVVRFGDSWPNAYTLPSAATNWTHIVAVKTTSNAYIYVNGSLVSTKGSSLSFGFNRELRIGGNQGSGEWFNGKIDEVALFDYALTPRQIKQDIYNATTSGKTADLNNNSNLTPPVAWYRMGD